MLICIDGVYCFYDGGWTTAYTSNNNAPGSDIKTVQIYTNRAPQSISFSAASVDYDMDEGGEFVEPVLSDAIGEVTYSSSNPSVATVDASTGEVTVLKVGSTVITHLFGGSAGREGAALQLGGSIGDKIGRVFRNEGLDTRHNPEFTLMELYQAYTDYHGMMDLTENLYRYVAQEVLGTTKIVYNGIEMDLGKPFARMTMTEAVKKYAGVDFDKIHTLEEARDAAKEHHVEFETRHKKGEILNLFFEQFCEEHMIQPTFIMDHPTDISPLTKMKPDNPEYVERFEFFMNGWEMANAYSELNDPIDQRRRFALQEEQFAAGDEEANHTDEDFLNALEIGMPPTGGIGFGIDRMCMLLTDSQAIRDVLLFPTMKRQGKKENGETEDEEE